MATTKPTLRADNPIIETFVEYALILINAASAYAQGGVYDAESDANMRRLRVISAALDAALSNIGITQPIVIPQPTAGPLDPGLGLGVENRIAALETRVATVEAHEGVPPMPPPSAPQHAARASRPAPPPRRPS